MKEGTFKSAALFLCFSVVVFRTYSVDANSVDEERLDRIFLRVYQGTEYPGNSTTAFLNNSCDLCPHLNASRSTVIFIHGWVDSELAVSTETVIRASMSLGTLNVLSVDWSSVANHDYAFSASKKVPIVARRLAVSIDNMIECCVDVKTLRLVGHSLGAQISGLAGRNMTNKLRQITGLDPAGPLFWAEGSHLIATDAECVDIIHTCSGLFGTDQYVGATEIYPNGGKPFQPGCPFSNETNSIADAGCSHIRSFHYFAETMRNPSSMFAVKCESYGNFKAKKCADNPVIRVGYEVPCNITGKFYYTTNPTSPYGRGMDGIKPPKYGKTIRTKVVGFAGGNNITQFLLTLVDGIKVESRSTAFSQTGTHIFGDEIKFVESEEMIPTKLTSRFLLTNSISSQQSVGSPQENAVDLDSTLMPSTKVNKNCVILFPLMNPTTSVRIVFPQLAMVPRLLIVGKIETEHTKIFVLDKNDSDKTYWFSCEEFDSAARNIDDMAPTCPAPIYGPTMADVCPAPNAVMFMMTVDAALRKDDSIAQISARVTSVDPETDYDFIVVGSGAGGSPVAGRLSKISDWKVLVLEAGVDEPIGTAVPSFNTCFTNSSVDWNYTTIEPNACLSTGGKCSWPRGKVLGGTTVIHGMMYTRGNPTDYKNWASEGLEGWTWSEVEPWFLVSENNTELDRLGTEHHARGGLMTVERLPYREPFDDDILIAAMEAGYAVTEDLCTDFSGYSIAQMMSKGGVRVSSAAAFLRPNRNRKNLHVSLESQATKIIIKDGRAIGVEYFKDGQLRKAYALKEVIVAGGAINSPQLLLLSGIGPRKDLEAVGIEVIKDLPGVGRNLHNHVSYTMSFTINDTYTYRMDKEALEQYLLDRRGPMSSKGIIATAILASNLTEPHFPDVQIFFRGYDAACAPGPRGALVSEGRRPIQISACYQHPKSRGYLRLASADPFDYPIMSANYFAEPGDVDGLVEAIKLALKIVDTPTMKSHDMQLADEPLEACSDHTFMSDKYLACAVRQNTSPENHQTGSAKMGPKNDSMAVVDEKFRVYGIEGLRVVDASIMPSVISSNPTAAIVMFGERAAAFIQEAWLYAS